MDPNATLRELLEMLVSPEPDRQEVLVRLEALIGWIDGEGFLPKVKQLPAGWEDANGKTFPAFAIGV